MKWLSIIVSIIQYSFLKFTNTVYLLNVIVFWLVDYVSVYVETPFSKNPSVIMFGFSCSLRIAKLTKKIGFNNRKFVELEYGDRGFIDDMNPNVHIEEELS